MTHEEIRSQLPRPELAKFSQVSSGLEVHRVLGNRVLVDPVTPMTDLDRLERGGLLAIPQAVKKEHTPRPSTGIVLAVGPEVAQEGHSALRVGEMVMFSKWGGMSFQIEDKPYLVLEAAEIVCTLQAVEGKTLADVVQAAVGDSTPDVPIQPGWPIL